MHHHHPTTSPHRTLLRCCHCRQLRSSSSPSSSSSSSSSSPSTSTTSSRSASPSASPPQRCSTCAHTLCPRCKITFKTRYRECWACGSEEVDIPFRRMRRSDESEEKKEGDGGSTYGEDDEMNGKDERCRRCSYPVGPGWVVKWGGAGRERWGEVLALMMGMRMER